MSEREFELYLSVLGGMMKLSSSQRKDLAEELRSHMDERLDDLMSEGLTRDEAIQTALEEFGDAAGLAANFTQIAQLKQRRRIMRWTTGTIAATTCAILALASFWPQNNPAGPLIVSTIDAQSETGDLAAGGIAADGSGGGAIDLSVPQNAIEAKLSQPFPGKVEFFDMPLSDVLDFISETIKVDILIDNRLLSRGGYDFDQSVNLNFQYGKVTTKTLLTLLFEQGDMDAGYLVRDEILYITSMENLEVTMTIRVYNCRDLVGEGSNSAMGMGVPGFGPTEYDAGSAGASNVSQFGGGSGGMAAGGFGGGEGYGSVPGIGAMGDVGSGVYPQGQHELVSVVTQTVAPHLWSDMGGNGSARLFNGLLVVKNTAEVHQQVEELLKMIREAQKVDPWNRKSISR